ncbi:DNA adenine methylase [Halanaerobium kushneri]|uniref:site-specific DNA-methyltransferase (adenine-specific) n=1 Tax=Halanaerobium kushneri TaxID=56779 RepID=A0A1N6PHQ7_9FIRM|nr:DNA adenine methylase [Halanaerobium kushneri]SIQ03813.1 DNA adenine methylase [Halanaerobium kushneri]
MRFYSPLRYPGGKGKLSDYMKLIIRKNNLLDGTYVEPFAGGGGIALSLLCNEYVSDILINDLSNSIYAFWYSVLNHTDKLCELISETSITVDEWHKQKSIQEQFNSSILELGFSTFFLNRTNRSGILQGGVIGGLEQNSKWKINARFNKENLIKRIKKISRYKDRIRLYNLDAANLITDVIPDLPNKTLVYLDPPYFNKGKHLYENYYKEEDHADLAEIIINKIEQHWIVTYDNTPEISKLYNECYQKIYSLSYSAAKKYKGSEIMVFSDKLVVPKIDTPVKFNVNE